VLSVPSSLLNRPLATPFPNLLAGPAFTPPRSLDHGVLGRVFVTVSAVRFVGIVIMAVSNSILRVIRARPIDQIAQPVVELVSVQVSNPRKVRRLRTEKCASDDVMQQPSTLFTPDSESDLDIASRVDGIDADRLMNRMRTPVRAGHDPWNAAESTFAGHLVSIGKLSHRQPYFCHYMTVSGVRHA
jgi:hypothetical protein